MDSGTRSLDRIFAVQVIGQPDVDSIDVAAFETLLVFFIGIGRFGTQAVALGKLSSETSAASALFFACLNAGRRATWLM